MAASEHRRGATLRLLLRVARVLVFTHGLGYIHPDEHFQSSEVTARALLSLSTRTAWEWCTPKPARSIVSAFLSSGVPHWLERWWHYGPSARYYVLIYGPRVWLACLSLVLDAFCASIGQNLGCADAATTVLASSWPVLAFFTRPFSNTIEALLAGATLYMAIGLFRWRQTVNALSGRSQKSHSEAVLSLVVALSGVISAVGVFVRFTFILFAGPSLAFLLWHGASVRIPGAGAPRRSLDSSQLWRLVRVGTLWMVCAGGTALALCIVDSMYFHHLRVVSPPAGIDYSRGYLTRLWGGLDDAYRTLSSYITAGRPGADSLQLAAVQYGPFEPARARPSPQVSARGCEYAYACRTSDCYSWAGPPLEATCPARIDAPADHSRPLLFAFPTEGYSWAARVLHRGPPHGPVSGSSSRASLSASTCTPSSPSGSERYDEAPPTSEGRSQHAMIVGPS
eukprot:scaffold4564_cov369-Prasinococcus_capsulatus_cf.AAC.7